MKIGVTSQNFRTVTGHAGRARRFLLYRADDGQAVETDRLDLPKEMSIHDYHGDDHPLFELDLLITAGAGDGFRRRLAAHGVRVIVTDESDPERAVAEAVRRLHG